MLSASHTYNISQGCGVRRRQEAPVRWTVSKAVSREGHPNSFCLTKESTEARALAAPGRGHIARHTCVGVLHQAQDHTRFLIDVEAQAILFLGHIDDEVGIGVH